MTPEHKATQVRRYAMAATFMLAACFAVSLFFLAYPIYVIRPFRHQSAGELAGALDVLRYRPVVMAICAALSIIALIGYWRSEAGRRRRIAACAGTVGVCLFATVSRINIYEMLFHPIRHPEFQPAEETKLDGREMVTAVQIGPVARAYPVRITSYHHVVNDVVNGVPIVATYWTLCHTGLVWGREVNGITLTFHLAGINNQNFLMRDEQTGTYWQQISGRAISGPLAGSTLRLIHSDELTLALWKAEQPSGTVLRDIVAYTSQYAPEDWDVKMKKAPTVLSYPEPGLAPRDLMVGIHAGGGARAFRFDDVLKQKLIEDRVGSEPVLLVVGSDGQSVRAFSRRLPNGIAVADFYRASDNTPGAALMMDSLTGSRWDFRGCGVEGPRKGECLEKVEAIKDYWFDWRNYNPGTTVFRR